MHELSVTRHLLDMTLHHAQQANAHTVTHIHITVGELSSIVDDSVQFYWNVLARDTAAAGAQLCFRRSPATLMCLHCHANVPFAASDNYVCSHCGSADVYVTGGDEFRLESIEVE